MYIGAARRWAQSRDHLFTTALIDETDIYKQGGYRTLWECLQRPVHKFPNNNAIGARSYKMQSNNKYQRGSDKLPVRGDYIWESFTEFDAAAREVGAGLIALGVKQYEQVGIFSENRPEWVHTSFGCYSQAMRVVALYATLGEEAVEYIVNHAGIKVIFVSKDNLPQLLKTLPKMQQVTHIIQYDVNDKYGNVEDIVSSEDKSIAAQAHVELIGISELRVLGSSKGIFPNPPKPDDLAMIMYTSGTTGNPKGVLLKHGSIVSSIATVPTFIKLDTTDRHISYLPLAHIFEAGVEGAMIINGAAIGFFQNQIKKLTEDWVALKPTILCGVPRVFGRVYQTVMSGVQDKNCVIRYYFNRAYNYQCEQVRHGKPLDPGYDKKVFAAIRERVGMQQVKVLLTGSAPCPPYLLEFLQVVMSAPVLQGYGMTESSLAISVSRTNDHLRGHVGPPLPHNEIKLVDVEDMGYLSSNQPPTGEICFRGPNVFSGYYKDDKNTAEAIDSDGWMHTGDIGRWNPNGTLSIIDRKKNMFKLSQGEYIAAEKIEQQYGKSPTVGQIFVYGNSYKSFLLAAVVPNAEKAKEYAVQQGWWNGSPNTKLGTPEFTDEFKSLLTGAHGNDMKQWVMNGMKDTEKSLKPFERVKDIVVEPTVDKLLGGFTEANGCLTPTFKLRRPQLLQRYVNQFKELYAINGEKDERPDMKY